MGIGAWWALSCDNYRRIKTIRKCTQSINILVVCFAPTCIIILKSARCVIKRNGNCVSSSITTSVQTISGSDIHLSSYAKYMHRNSRTQSCKLSVSCCPTLSKLECIHELYTVSYPMSYLMSICSSVLGLLHTGTEMQRS